MTGTTGLCTGGPSACIVDEVELKESETGIVREFVVVGARFGWREWHTQQKRSEGIPGRGVEGTVQPLIIE